jgi:hypothetical protein
MWGVRKQGKQRLVPAAPLKRNHIKLKGCVNHSWKEPPRPLSVRKGVLVSGMKSRVVSFETSFSDLPLDRVMEPSIVHACDPDAQESLLGNCSVQRVMQYNTLVVNGVL